MKTIIFLSSLLCLNVTHALNTGKYKCQIFPKGSQTKAIGFSFEYLPEGELKCLEGDEDYCEVYFRFEDEEQRMFSLNGLYDGDYGFDKKKNFSVSSDQDGCDIGELILYKNSGYKKGFITSSFNCSSGRPSFTGSVFCSLSK